MLIGTLPGINEQCTYHDVSNLLKHASVLLINSNSCLFTKYNVKIKAPIQKNLKKLSTYSIYYECIFQWIMYDMSNVSLIS